jgi:cell division septal protein FtsQ
VACLGLAAAIYGGMFRVRQVEVVGASLPMGAIVQAAGVEDQNIFTVQTDRVVARLSRVNEIVVRRVETVFPDRIVIYADERVPVATWQSGRRLFEVDAAGVIIRQVAAARLPIIAGVGSGATPGPGALQAVRYALQVLPAAPGGAVSSFRFGTGTGLSILGRAGWTAEIGTGPPQTMVARVASLASLLASPRVRRGHLQYVDLRLPDPYAQLGGA